MAVVPLSRLLRQAIERFRDAGLESPALDARILVAHALGVTRADLIAAEERDLSAEELAKIEALIARRAKREPVSRILGEREFWSLPFGLNEATLDPRPDSETLVEMALEMVKQSMAGLPIHILDLGTGSGCLLLALLHELPEARGIGLDLSPRAVEQAQTNAERLGLADRLRFAVADWNEARLSDLLRNVIPASSLPDFDLIVSNPPYIPRSEVAGLMPDVRDYDPRAALDGGADGLDPYRLLIPQLPALLTPNGCAVFEVGQGQAEAVAEMFRQAGLSDVFFRRDLSGVDRCLAGRTVPAHIPE